MTTPNETWSKGLANSYLEQLSEYWKCFEHGHVALLHHDFGDHEYFAQNEYDAAEANALIARGRLYDVLSRVDSVDPMSQTLEPMAASTPCAARLGGLQDQPTSQNNNANAADGRITLSRPLEDSTQLATIAEPTATNRSFAARLNRIDLPSFDGDRKNWESFRDMFRALVDQDPSLQPVEKLAYLNTAVRGGNAESTIRNFALTDSSYIPAWKALSERYDQPRLLIRDHLETLLTTQALSVESEAGLRGLHDRLVRSRGQLQALNCPVEHWDDWLVTIGCRALDPVTRREWEEEMGERSQTTLQAHPSFAQFAAFLRRRLTSLSSLPKQRPAPPRHVGLGVEQPRTRPKVVQTFATTTDQGTSCSACSQNHYLGHCSIFKGTAPSERRDFVRRQGLCFNCLKENHAARVCPSHSSCRQCDRRHHTLIHNDDTGLSGPTPSKVPRLSSDKPATTSVDAAAVYYPVVLKLGDGRLRVEPVRALLDPCSEVTLVNLRLARRLGTGLERVHVNISGVSGSPVDAARVRTRLYLHDSSQPQPWSFEAYGLQRIGIITPSTRLPVEVVREVRELKPADPHFADPGPVDAVLGENIYGRLLLSDVVHTGQLTAQRTLTGWCFSGIIEGSLQDSSQCAATHTTLLQTATTPTDEQLLEMIRRFWAVEEVPQAVKISPCDQECEEIFFNEHHRDPTGRYVVPLPIKANSLHLLGESLPSAYASLAATHRRMQRDPEFGRAYQEFMRNYEKLGHMRRLTLDELESQPVKTHYIPHHGICQCSDEGRKFRVVFNASRPTSSGYSLNDILHVGGKLQNSIILVIILWRMLCVVFCCDIRMMFRHIKMDPRYVHLQRVLWSESADQPIAHWALCTVTYGEAPSPYLAERSLQQLCLDEGRPFPLAVDAVKRRRYVDDIMAGGHDLESASSCRNQLTKLLNAGGFTLKKWVSNSPELLNKVDPEDRLRTSWVQFSTDGPVNELGLAWDPTTDCFKFTPSPPVSDLPPTKRRALAELAKIFDPAGWLAPVTVKAKMIIQDLWRAKLDWDDEIPGPLHQRWIAFRKTMERIDGMSIPRWTQHQPTNQLELHAFADASRRAIAAAIYCRTAEGAEAEATTTLLWAKTKLAPVKNLISSSQRPTRMTIPRLELRAALLAARLLKATADCLQAPLSTCQAWSDSQIVLHWIRSADPTGNDFVDNYVAQIHELVPAITWRYISTTENPADAGTRGLDVPTLCQSRI